MTTLVAVTFDDEYHEFWFCAEHDHDLISKLAAMEADCKADKHEVRDTVSQEPWRGLSDYLMRDEESQQSLWEAVFGSSGETWDWWHAVRLVEGDWDKIGRVYLEVTNPDDEMGMPVNATIGIQDVADAYAKAVARGYRDACTGRRLTLDLDAGLDACSSDVVLQIAVLGDVVYG